MTNNKFKCATQGMGLTLGECTHAQRKTGLSHTRINSDKGIGRPSYSHCQLFCVSFFLFIGASYHPVTTVTCSSNTISL